MGLLLEKGSLSRLEYETTAALLQSHELPKHVSMDKLFERSFLWSSRIKFRIPRNAQAAFTVYTEIFSTHGRHGRHSINAKMQSANRIALRYYRGAGEIDQDFAEAETLYTTMLEGVEEPLSPHAEYYILAMCNLAVLHRQQGNSPEKSIQLVKNAVEISEEHEKLGSSAMNNLAVLNESGELMAKNLDEAKKLYRRSIHSDENPVAMYNLAVLLKFEDPNPANQREAELFSSVADLGVDLESIPVLASELEKVKSIDLEVVAKGFQVDVEEIDDCLAYVKVGDRRS